MKQQLPITVSIAAAILASIYAIPTASAQTQFSTFTGPNGKDNKMNKAIFLVPVIACLFTGAAPSVTVQQGQALTSGKNTIKTHTPINLDTLKKATEMII